ncbi:universal stress protein [Zhongshania aquimaris]|uniref:Universal stress protein n=1 Tax=Zhongshania aquimaris TaxID=2857107 RepID=A0ABS6VVA9_9GAMM|nr:universal stress protein [Zhongshania aquimaris]MBW2942275.1 universal stress protein [Zhongshania aquimaris]
MNNNYVLACIDGASLTTAVCDYAAWMSQRTGAPLKLLHNIEHRPQAAVADLSGSIGLGSQEELLEELTRVEQQRNRLLMQKGKLMLEAATQRVEQADVANVEAWQQHGSLQESLVELEGDIRVLVMGVRGEEHREGQLGAHLETVIRALHKPVLVVNAAFAVPKKIMLAYDGQDASRKALDMVASSPVFKDIPCHLVYVGDESKANSVLNEAAAVLQTAGVSHELVNLPKGKSDEQLCHYQAENDIDLTVMGAYSHHPLRDMLLGSLTAKMLHKTKRPLLLLR